MSSAIRVLPRNGQSRGKRQTSSRKPHRHNHYPDHHHQPEEVTDNHLRRRRQAVQSYRRPREFNFVTNKADRLPPPPIVRVYPPAMRDERAYDQSYRKGQRRIIYYANLPEIVRPPMQWYNPRRDYFYDSRQVYPSASSTIYSPTTSYSSSSPVYSSTNSFSSTPFASSSQFPSSSSQFPSSSSTFSSSSPTYPSPSENEITRVQSNIIDVTGGTSSRYDRFSSSPKFTIIDVEPPYNSASYNHRPINFEPYSSPQYTTSNRFFNDVRTPPYRDQSYYPNQNFRPEVSMEPVKLQLPTTEFPLSSTSTESPTNTTRFLPDILPVNLRSLSKFVT